VTIHVNAAELVDIAEGTRLESSVPHLAACERCRAELRHLRAMMSAVQDLAVPEPSPLFWDHLSSRVSEAVAAEAAGAPPARLGGWRSVIDVALARLKGSRPFVASVAAAAVLIVVALSSRAPAPVRVPPSVVSVADAGIDVLSDLTSDDDASLTLVASLTDDQDLDTVREAGLAPRGTADHAVAHMSDGELRELGRLLKEALARPGA
jgi:hypothetical protein